MKYRVFASCSKVESIGLRGTEIVSVVVDAHDEVAAKDLAWDRFYVVHPNYDHFGTGGNGITVRKLDGSQ